MPVVRKDLYLLHRSTEIGHRPIPEQPGLDGAKGVQVEQLHRIGPLLPGDPPLRLHLLLRVAPEFRLGFLRCDIGSRGVHLGILWCDISLGGRDRRGVLITKP